MKYIKIILTKKDKFNKRKQIDRVLITDNLAITKFSDPNQSFKIYNEKRKEGKQNVGWARGVLTEEYPDTTTKQIKELMIAQIEALKTKMGKSMEINYEVEEK